MSPNTLREDTRKTLERVVAKANALRNSTFFRELDQGAWHISFRQREVLVARPPDEARDSFVLNLRFFILGNEATSFRSLAKLVSEPDLSEEWKARVRALRAAVNEHLSSGYGEYRFDGGTQRYSDGQILDTFPNGGLVHANDSDAVARFEKWRQYPGIAALLELRFITTIRFLCLAIFLLCDACKEELEANSQGS